jgi:hypothetical protein
LSAIAGQVAGEVARLYPVLGTVRTDARLLKATSSGTLHRLSRSNAPDDYTLVAARLRQLLS